MEINTPGNTVYVGEFRGDMLLIVAGSRLKDCLWHVEMTSDLAGGLSLENVYKKFGTDEVREALRDPLLGAWFQSKDDPDWDAQEAPKSFMPDYDLLSNGRIESYEASRLQPLGSNTRS